MKLEIQMELNNAAYREYAPYPEEGALIHDEVANSLDSISSCIRCGQTEGRIHDYNGNNVGFWRISHD